MLSRAVLTGQRVRELADAIRKVKVCVVGDICLDLYWYADMRRSRLSRETPHFPLPVVQERSAPGGGGNVVANVRALGVARLLPVSMIGEDWRGFLLKNCLAEQGIEDSYILPSGHWQTPCYCKPMRMGLSDVVYEDPRLDFENLSPMRAEDEARVLKALERAAPQADVIAVSDQCGCGVITPAVRKRLSDLAGDRPVIVDSRERIADYTGVIIKPNEVEAAVAVGWDITGRQLSIEEYAKIGGTLRARTGKPVVITLGERGALWCDESGAVLADTVKAEPPVDIVGAGDTFLSAFSCALAAGAQGGEALAFANLASAVTVKKIGTTGAAGMEEILQKYQEYYA